MNDLQLTISGAERDTLVQLLKGGLRDVRVEEHRTEAPDFRAHVSERAEHIESLLRKLGQTVQ